MQRQAIRSSEPWYRHRWPWLLMAGPATVVVAGIVTTVIAVRTSDPLVADDYYKQGLGINRMIEREARARALGVTATVRFGADATRVRVTLAGAQPPALRLTLVHPTRAGEDQSVPLAALGNGVYEGALAAPRSPTLIARLEDPEAKWRLTGAWQTRQNALTLVPE